MTIWVYTGGRPSNSARELGRQEGFKRAIRGRAIRPREFLINWGSSQAVIVERQPLRILNVPGSIAKASNKLHAFQAFGEANVASVDFCTAKHHAQLWADDGAVVVARTKLTGHSGDGIIIIDKAFKEAGTPFPNAPLYTKYVFKQQEYRTHVVNGRVIDTQQKIRDPAREPTSWKVRSHANGFIYARDNVVAHAGRDALAIAAVAALGLDFGAVDIIHNKEGVPLLLEVNTAPGLEGQTVQSYAEAFRGYQG